MAEKLGRELGEHGFDAFVDERSIAAGENIILAIGDAVAQADYFVLLWSQHSLDRPWLDLEWTGALTRELDERRSFLFIVKLDETPLPSLLAPRKYLDAFGHSDRVAKELAATWLRHKKLGLTVLPAPCLVDTYKRPAIVLYVRNRALSVAHVVVVPADANGSELHVLVRTALALPHEQSSFGGTVGMRFRYRLMVDGVPVADRPPAELRIAEYSTLDLTVEVEQFGPDGSTGRSVFRNGEAQEYSDALTHTLIRSAFGHLIPRPSAPCLR
jgi:hypothetical protein